MKSGRDADLISATLTSNKRRHFRTWAVLTGLVLVSFAHAQQAKVHLEERARPIGISFGPDSDHLLTGSDGYLQLWNWRQEKLIGPRFLVNRKHAKDPTKSVLKWSLRFSRDGRFMASCRDRKDTDAIQGESMLAQVWDLHTGATVAELSRTTPLESCHALDFSPDGNTLAVVANTFRGSNAVIFFETRGWTEIRRTDFGPDARLHDQLNYSSNGKQLVVWASDVSVPPGMTQSEYSKANRLVGTNFLDHKIEAIVLNAADGQVLARRVLHWTPKHLDRAAITNGFDASGDRVLSSVPFGGVIEDYEEAIYKNCPDYKPRNIPEGFQAMDLCRKHKALQVWHWRTGKVETLFEYPTYIRTQYYARESPEIWTAILEPQFTADGRFLVQVRADDDKADFDPNSTLGSPSVYTLEIRDAQTYQLVLTKALAGKDGGVRSPLQLSPDGRYLTLSISKGRKYSYSFTNYLYEILSK